MIVWVFTLLLALQGTALGDPARGAIDAANVAFKRALLKGDAIAVGNLYTPEAKIVAPGGDPVRGRAAITLFWKQIIDSGLKHVTMTTSEVESAGDLAYEEGTIKLTASAGNESAARYMIIWKRNDGAWKIHREIWNHR